jgi:hypothetical protein
MRILIRFGLPQGQKSRSCSLFDEATLLFEANDFPHYFRKAIRIKKEIHE